ncbi:MAG: glycosyltransferase family 4 protein [Flavobacteriales bacterium]
MIIAFDAKRVFHNRSGLGNFGRDLVRMMSRELPDSQLVLLNPKASKLNFDLAENMLEIRPKQKLFSSVWRMRKAYDVARNQGAEIFHGLSNELPYGSSKGLKTVVSIHDLIFLRYPDWYKPIDRKIYLSKTKHACQKADCIVAISEQSKRDLIEFLNVPEEKIKVIYQTCHPAFRKIYSAEELEIIRKKYNLPQGFCLNVGSFEPRKNVKLILKALKKLPNEQFVAIGKHNAYLEELNALAKDLGVEMRFRTPVVDSMEDLAKIYQLADVFIYPSVFEGFGIPIIEALYSKTPVITNKFGVFAEAAGPNSFYIDVDKVEELVSAVKQIRDPKTDLKHRIEESRNFAEQFNPEQLSKIWKKLYQQLLS